MILILCRMHFIRLLFCLDRNTLLRIKLHLLRRFSSIQLFSLLPSLRPMRKLQALQCIYLELWSAIWVQFKTPSGLFPRIPPPPVWHSTCSSRFFSALTQGFNLIWCSRNKFSKFGPSSVLTWLTFRWRSEWSNATRLGRLFLRACPPTVFSNGVSSPKSLTGVKWLPSSRLELCFKNPNSSGLLMKQSWFQYFHSSKSLQRTCRQASLIKRTQFIIILRIQHSERS